MSQAAANSPAVNRSKIFARFGEKYGVDPCRVSHVLTNTIFKNATDEQIAALLIVAEQFNLNPFTREIYAFSSKNGGGIVPLVSVDGWFRIVNERPDLDGFEFNYGPETFNANGKKNCPEWIECIIRRKGRDNPIIVREYMEECIQGTGPWQSHPRRMLRHKAFIQCARMAFGFSGIYDEEEGRRIAEARVVTAEQTMPMPIDVEASAPEIPQTDRFGLLLDDMGITGERLRYMEIYITTCMKHFNAARDEVIGNFLKREEDFRRTYPQWEESYLKAEQKRLAAQAENGPVKASQEPEQQQADLLTSPDSPPANERNGHEGIPSAYLD